MHRDLFGLPVARAIGTAASFAVLSGIGSTSFAQVDSIDVPRPGQSRDLSERMTDMYDTGLDAWSSEQLNDATGPRLKKLQKLLEGSLELDPATVGKLVHADFAALDLNPGELATRFDDRALRVLRWDPEDPGERETFRGVDGAARLFERMRARLGRAEIHAKCKVVEVDPGEHTYRTGVLFHASGHTDAAGNQHNATWNCTWTLPGEDGHEEPMLLGIELGAYEEVTLAGAHGPLFVDCTASAMKGAPLYEEQLLLPLRGWVTEITSLNGMSDIGHHGLAIGDPNGDGLEDVYYADAGGLPNRLFLQQPDGTVVDVAPEAGVDWLDYSAGALFADLDNDGDEDLIVTTRAGILVSENDGNAKFTLRRTLPAGIDAISIAAADYDGDRDLDFFVCQYRASKATVLPTPVPLYDAQNGERNLLWRNDGDFEFVDAAAEAGLADETRFSFAAAWEDYDDDGDPDLYVANDFGPNNLYRNDGDGTFTDVAPEASVEDRATGMSVTWGDYNRDGRMDAYVGNMFSSAGNRVTFERRFADVSGEEGRDVMRRFARGNTLFANNGDGTFVDTSLESETTMGRWAWASKFVDVNNDGWEDLLIANGFLTNEGSGDL